MLYRTTHSHILGTATLLLCIALFVFSGVPRAEAGGGIGGAVTGSVSIIADNSATSRINTIKNTLSEISSAISANAQSSLLLKEMTLDGIARNVAQSALNQLTADMINWVNGGFDGEPAFITNFEDYMSRVADEAAGEFIYGAELENLCEPVKFQVQATLLAQYAETGRGETYTPQCTLENIGVDVEAFVGGDYDAGGIVALFELTVGNNNDTVKAYYQAKGQLDKEIARSQDAARTEANWNDGFLSKKACQTIESSTGFPIERCETLTPGSLISDTLSYYMGELPAQRLLNIDEFNEVFGSLASNLTNQAIQGTFGLLGLGGNSRYSDSRFGDGSQTYAAALRNEQTNINGVSDAITKALDAERSYLELQEDILEDIEALEDELADAAEDEGSCFDLDLSDELTTDKENAEKNIETSTELITILEEMETKLDGASSAAEQNAVYEQYFVLETNDLIKTSYDVTKLRTEFVNETFADRVEAFEEAIDEERASC